MKHIKDKNFVKGIYNRARRTLPHGLTIEPVETHATRTGVWAQTTFSKGLIFGPYEGPVGNSAEEWKDFQLSKTFEDLDNKFNERMCNWMIFVNSARNKRETNFEPVFYNGTIFFRSSKSINKGDQLLISTDVKIISNLEGTDVKLPDQSTGRENASINSMSGLNSDKNCNMSESVPSSTTHILDEQSPIPEDDELSFDLNEYLQQNQIELIEKPVNYNPHNRTEPVCYRGTCPPGKTIRGNEPYMCKQCGARFAHVSVLMKHENTHMEDLGRYRCTYCGRVFVQKGSLIKHEEIHTINQKLSICKVCSVCFEGQSDLDEHFKLFHSSEVGRAFPCFVCGIGFNKVGNLRSHQRLKHPGKISQKCRFCMKTFRSKAFLNSHEYQHLSDKPFACQFCSFKFQTGSKILSHLRRMHKNEVESTAMSERESLTCYYCGYTFSVHTQFIKHVKVCNAGLHKDTASPVSSVAKKHIKCSECTNLFSSEKSLKSHMRVQHADKPFKCSICLQCFKFSRDLKKHILIHMNQGPSAELPPADQDSVLTWNYKNANHVFFCNTCNTSFLDINFYQKHQCTKDPSNAKSILVCPVCRRGFYGKSQHTRHVALCKNVLRSKSRAYTKKQLLVYCKCCKTGFHNRKELCEHKRFCSGAMSEKQNTLGPIKLCKRLLYCYGCGICQKAFSKSGLLKSHLIKLHPEEHNNSSRCKNIKLNMCKGCKKCFLCLKGLSKHVRSCSIVVGKTSVANNQSDSTLPSKSFSCKMCSKTFKNIILFNEHRLSCKLRNCSRKSPEVNKATVSNTNQGTSIMKGARFTNQAKPTKDATKSVPVCTCKKCGRAFIYRKALGKHKVNCRQIPEKPTSSVSNTCPMCSRTFLSRNTLTAHKMVCIARKGRKLKQARRPVRHKCSMCSRVFLNHNILVAHKMVCVARKRKTLKETVNKEAPVTKKQKCFPCICGKSFRCLQSLKRHKHSCMPDITSETANYYPGSIDSQSKNSDDISCKICGKTFKRIQGLAKHELTCIPNIAGDRYPSKDSFEVPSNNKKLEKIKTSDSDMLPNDLFICRKCGTSFEDEGKLVEHDYVCCPEFEFNVFARSKCSTTLPKEVDLGVHEQSTSTTNYPCDICGRTFSNKGGLGKHKKIHKVNNLLRPVVLQNTQRAISSKRFKCKTCGNSFSSQSALRKHRRLNRCKIYHNCTVCGVNFKSVHAFEQHSVECKETRLYLCNICGRGFTVVGFLKRHMLILHDKSLNTSSTSHESNKQRKPNEQPTELEKRSELNKAGSILRIPNISSRATGSYEHQSPNNDSYKCGICLKKFPTLEAFADHEEAEHYKKNECYLCLESFKTERELILHRKYHTDVYPHKCKMCSMRYKFSAHLRRHFQKKHK
ncbi:zinc finger protein 729-like [Anneissia japonica]|uniref:zinc finger protein 729-like n=1 Tax=Anneissia japonica TaxID=1529436 RepID=UPI00142552B1|nr:zinc finger protein 729-like [Anneissia japonica]XP_033095536.1 zinc finger protein 729-like [Anneissia japonica]